MLTGLSVTPSTSLVLVKKLVSPSYIVYLNALQCPDFTVAVRDITGSTLIQQYPVTLSTIGGALFSDGTTTHLLNAPYGFIELGFRQSSIWQVLHTSGFSPAQSAGTVNNLQVSTLNVGIHSTGTKVVSTLVLENLNATNAIQIAGTVAFTNLSTTGLNTFASTFHVYGDVLVGKNLYVSGPMQLESTLAAAAAQLTSFFIDGSYGIGKNLSIGNTLNAISSLSLASTVQVQTLQVQRSTGEVAAISGDLIVGGAVSTLSSLIVGQSTFTTSSLTLLGNLNVAELTVARNLVVNAPLQMASGLSTIGSMTFVSSLTVGKDITIQGSVQVSSFTVASNVTAATISSQTLTTLQTLQAGQTQVRDSVSIASNLSTHGLFIGSSFAVAGDVQTQGGLTITAFSNLSSGYFSVGGSATVGSITNVSVDAAATGPFTLGVGNSVQVGSDAYLGDLSVVGNITVRSNALLNGPLNVAGSADVQRNLFVQDFNLTGSASLSNIEAQNYNVHRLDVASSLTVSTLLADEISTLNLAVQTSIFLNQAGIYGTDHAFLSTLQTQKVVAYSGTVERMQTESLYLETERSTINSSNPVYYQQGPALFMQGLSTHQISTGLITATLFEGQFQGDGGALTNVPLQFETISSLVFYASTTSAYTLYTSAMTMSTLTVLDQIYGQSTFQTDTFRIDPIGYPINRSTNQFLVVSPTSLLINRTNFLDMASRRLGINTSTPQYDLDVNGVVYASTLLFSSIQEIDYTSTTAFFNNLTVSTLYVRDALYVTSTTGTLRFPGIAPGYLDLDITSYNTNTYVSSGVVAIQAYPSTLLLNNIFHVRPSTIGIGDASLLSISSVSWPRAPLDVYGPIYTSSLIVSTALIESQLTTGNVYFSTLELYGGSTVTATAPTHTIRQYSTLFVLDDLVYIDRATHRIGIKTSSPITTLEVNGTICFSNLTVANGLTVSTITYEMAAV